MNTQLFAEPEENKRYTITSVKEVSVETKTGTFSAYRVELHSVKEGDTKIYSVTLWSGESAGSKSKLGSFIDAFQTFFKGSKDEYETDNWVNHTILVKNWQQKDRQIEVKE